jgi:hypothetical protein
MLKDRTVSRYSDVRSAISTEPSFSPDGRWIVYQRSDNPAGRSETLDVFIEPFPATGAKYQVPLKAGHPFWSRTGDRLFFNSGAATSTVINVRTTPTVVFSNPRDFPRARRSEPNPSLQRRWADAMPDGRVFGITNDLGGVAAAATAPQFNVVLNWLPSLTAKLGR